MGLSESASIDCPYCGELFEITVDTSVGRQDYIEDCEVCCRPIQFRIRAGANGLPQIEARREDEA